MSKVHEESSPSTYENPVSNQAPSQELFYQVGLENSYRSVVERQLREAMLPSRVEYWLACRRFIEAVGNWAKKVKLLESLESSNPNPEQQKVLEYYYGGDIYNLTISTGNAYKQLVQAFLGYRQKAVRFGFNRVELEFLLRFVIDSGERKKFLYHIDKHLRKKDEPFPFEQIPEKDFRSR